MRTIHLLAFWALGVWPGLASAQYIRTPEAGEHNRRQAPVRAEVEAEPEQANQADEIDAPDALALDLSADRLEYDADRRVMMAVGNVVARHAGDVLTCDYLEYHTGTQAALARGNVQFNRAGRIWEGEEITYNFATRTGDFGEFILFNDPYYIRAEDARRTSATEMTLENLSFTTCEESDPEFIVRAKNARITDSQVLRAKHVRVYLYGVPILYTPYWKKDFSGRSNWEFVPGYSSRMGAFLLTTYSFNVNPHLRSITHFDVRTKRGVGVGQTMRWDNPEQRARGQARVYYANDQEPIRSETQRGIREGLIDQDRYRIGLSHSQALRDRLDLRAEFNYLSDPFVLEDFFDDEFRRNVQPENRLTLTHRDDNFVAALAFNVRVNDFFENVNRTPEATLDISRQQIGNTPFYYEGENSAAYLERVFPEQQEDVEDYDAFRVDSRHAVLYPTKQLGFLSVIPSMQYRGTWYSETFTSRTITNSVNVVDEETGDVVSTTNETSTVFLDDGAQLRNVYEFGLETSYKAFKVLSEEPNYWGRGLRHVAEPYAKYTKVPEPNLLPENIYQFDAIDRLNERDDILFGVRNKLQTRRGANEIHEFVYINTYSVYYLDPASNQNNLDDIFFDSRLRLTDWMFIDLDGSYDWDEGEFRRFNARSSFVATDRSRLSLEYRFDRDRRESLTAEARIFPENRWSFGTYWRLDLDEGKLDEHSYLVSRRFNCTRLGVGIRARRDIDGEDEWRAWAQISLLAFPDSEINLGR
jgi:LPS-assembly protein